MRTVLKTNYKHRKEVFEEIERLYSEFKSTYKRNPNSELVYAELGPIKNSKFELAVYAESADSDEVEFFKQNIK